MASFVCAHCRGEFDENCAVAGLGSERFCCNGCKGVYYFLRENGLGEFYARLGKQTHVKARGDDISSQSVQSFFKNYVKQDGQICEIYLIIEGIHCSACIWLNEKALSGADGVLEASINATTNKAKIRWDNRVISLAKILNIVVSIGYNPVPYDPSKSEAKAAALRREFYVKMLVGVFCTMNLMWIAVALYGGYFSGMDSDVKNVLHFGEFVLASPVLFYTGGEFFRAAWVGLKNKVVGMDFSVAAGAGITYFYSVYAMLSKRGEVYFDSVAMIITFVFIGKFLEVISKKRAIDSLDGLSALLVSQIYVKNGAEFSLKNVRDVQIGEQIMVRSGERAQIDGRVISGSGEFDVSSINGESVPLSLGAGAQITSGAACLSGAVVYEATKTYENSVLNKIINLLENAPFKKPKIEILANKIAAGFSLLILTLGCATFAFWFWIGGTQSAIITAISVIVIACPCALGLATPVASLVGLGSALKRGVVFKEARILERVATCKTIIFDKTGTLSKGKLKVVKMTEFSPFDANLLYSLASVSAHQISVAVRQFVRGRALDLDDVAETPGSGVAAKFDGVEIRGGKAEFVGLKDTGADGTNYYFSVGGKIVAKLELQDELKDDARAVVADLQKSGYEIILLSGDGEKIVEQTARELGITKFYARANPLEKARVVEQNPRCIMVGDGINDLAALKLASVGICMGSGAGVSVQNSDVVLLKDDLESLKFALNLSKFTFKTIKQNLAISLVYNAIALPFAMLGYVIPLFAAALMSLSSLVVVLNSSKIRLKGQNWDK